MPKTKISEYSATANSNTDVASINIDEGCAPSGINNAIRAIMGHLKDFQSGTSNDPFTVGSSGSLTLSYGTANGVAYLNGSKVLTTGSALTFDGTNFGVTTIKSTTSLNLYAASAYDVNLYTGATNTARLSSNVNGIFTVGDVGSVAGLGTNYGTLGAWGSAGGGYRIYRGTGAGTSIAYLYADASGVFLTGQEAVPMVFSTSGTERARIDSSGNLLVGQTSKTTGAQSTAKLGVSSGITLTNGSYGGFMEGLNTSGTTYGYLSLGSAYNAFSAGDVGLGTSGALPLLFATNNAEAARIDSSGNLMVGTTSVINSCKVSIVANYSIGLKGSSVTNSGDISFNRADTGAQAWRIASDGTNWYLADADFSNYAYVAQNFTAWSFGSDRRIKTDIVDIEYGLNAVMAMKPRKYKMLASGLPSIGFIAQELQTVIPEAVQGEEIEYLDTDTPKEKAAKTMGVSKDTLIPVLVKAIQELKAEFDAYKASHP